MAAIKTEVGGARLSPAFGKPLKHDEIVSEGDAGSAEIEAELREEQPSQDHTGDKAGDGADLVNVGKFNDDTILDDGRDPTEPDGGEKRTKDADRSVADVFGIDPKHLHRPD